MNQVPYRHPERVALLQELLSKRVLVTDGAMGTMIQALRLEEEDFRGARFATHPVPLKGNNDLVSLTRPDLIRSIHQGFLEAGADLLETNTFNSTSISQADYATGHLVRELNRESARIAVSAASASATNGQPRFVMGALGPTNRTASLSPDVNRPEFRNTSFDEMCGAYSDAAQGLAEGGCDLLIVETVFDTLNCKAALFGIGEAFAQLGYRLPIVISGTIIDASGRTLSGQTVEAFWYSIRHVRPFAVGLNCALGAEEIRPWIRALSHIAECPIILYPNAGLPNELGDYDDTPEHMSQVIGSLAEEGLLNIAGGAAGPLCILLLSHRYVPRPEAPAASTAFCRLAGLEPLVLTPDLNFVNVGERTNVTGSARFRKLIEKTTIPLRSRLPGSRWQTERR
jgi:5-methyltetrahydrofolate--homocysteine methyltransferase